MTSSDSNIVINVMVCLATVTSPRLVMVQMPTQVMMADAVRVSGLLHGLDLTINTCKLGVYGERKAPDTALYARDQVEILGPLIADPKAVRRWCMQKVWVTGTREGLKWLCNEAPPKDDVLE